MNVVKINIGADIVRAWMKGLKEGELLDSGHEPPHQVMMRHASVKVTEVARAKLSLMGASHRAKPLLRKLEDATAYLVARSAAPVTV
jgi:hypothetical protein